MVLMPSTVSLVAVGHARTNEEVKHGAEDLKPFYPANIQVVDGATALLVASQQDHTDIVRLLKNTGRSRMCRNS
jgi:ankyrin repeat protein